MNRHTIAIVGGGFTGLVAAMRLAEKGVQVTVIEAGSELGGLAASFEMQGEPLEKAYHHLFRSDEDILKLIEELGLNERLEWFDSSVGIYRDGRLWPFMSPLDLLKFSPCSLLGRFRLGLVALFLKHYKNWKHLAKKPALEWMRKYCGKSATQVVWEPLLRGKFSKYAEEISMGWLWARLHVRTNSREAGGGGEKLGYIRGGFIQIISKLEQRLTSLNVKIEKNTRVERIESFEDRIKITRNGVEECFDNALFTGSNPALIRLLSKSDQHSAYCSSLQKTNYLGAVCMIFETDQKLGNFYWININEPDSPFLVFIRHTRLIPNSRYNHKEIYYLGAYVPHDDSRFTMTEEELKQQWFPHLANMFPDFSAEQITDCHCFKFRDAQHIVDCAYEDHIPSHIGPFKGFYLANFSQIFPYDRGTNFAVQEGEKIARQIATDLSI